MTLQELNDLIDKAIENSAIRPEAMPKTNILNAEYGLGAIYAYIDIIWKEYGIDAFCETIERTEKERNDLLNRTQTIYS